MADHSTHSGTPRLLDRFRDEPFGLTFAGGGEDWLNSLGASVTAGGGFTLDDFLSRAADVLEPVAAELEASRPCGFDPVAWTQAGQPPAADLAHPALAVPGGLVAQIAACELLKHHGLNYRDAAAVAGYSHGSLGALYAGGRAGAPELLAIAQLIGAALSDAAQAAGLVQRDGRAPMVVVAGASRGQLQKTVDRACAGVPENLRPVIGLRETRDSFILVGRPEDNDAVLEALRRQAGEDAQAVANKERGGTPFHPRLSPLADSAARHHPALFPAVEQTVAWAKQAGLDAALAREAAETLLVAPVDWPAEIMHLLDEGVKWILDLGPGEGVDASTREVVAGRGVGAVAVGKEEGQAALFDAESAPAPPTDWAEYTPTLEQRDGCTRLVTRFTELTGRSPMLLAGMTPTTVDPAIVAAAANAGHWAELAGGGQVTPEIFQENLDTLVDLLEPGVHAQFNTMFLNPYLWNMHFGEQKIVVEARRNGAPFDGVVISAGIPPLDDAVPLIHELREAGFPWIAFKPGAVRHIQKALAVADAVPEVPVILHVEGGKAGGHHSWNDLDELLIAAYGDIRARANTVLVVGGGIGTPEQAADYITGSWAEKYDLPAMPVDGILIGTAAMATREATTSPQVKQMLVEAQGGLEWIGAGTTKNGVASGRSQLGADLYEVENSFARAGRLLDEVADDADAVAARRDEIIEALSRTAKVYFGDLETMTYRAWLHRYLELSGPTGEDWIDASWHHRFVDMLGRVGARCAGAEPDEFIPAVEPTADDAPAAAVARLAAEYPGIDDVMHPDDAAWFLAHCRAPGKPVNFVPVIDADVRRWWRSDSLWQAHDPRYPADAVCVIPGPAAVAGITQVDEPVADLLDRFNRETVDRLEDARHRQGRSGETDAEMALAASR